MRRFFAPEVVQTSALDCGPAALNSLLGGFGIAVSYGRLREACQTGIDGTSIDTVEAVANALGIQAEQVMLPSDHLFLPKAKTLPAIAVVTVAGGLTHFVVIWRRHGRYLQVMDPAAGRRWVEAEQFQHELYLHQAEVPASGWREFAASDEFQQALSTRLHMVRVSRRAIQESLRKAAGDAGWRGLATLDAAARALHALDRAGSLSNAQEADRVLAALCAKPASIPGHFWSVRHSGTDADGEDQLIVRGAVLVRALGRGRQTDCEQLGSELEAAVRERPVRPVWELWKLLREGGWLTPAYLFSAIPLTVCGLLIEALLFRGLFDVSTQLHLAGQRIGAMAALILFSAVIFVLEFLTFLGATRIGRILETRLRLAFLRKIPKLGDRYFQSRLISDMGERSHATHRLRHLPDLGRHLSAAVFELVATAVAMIWLEPATAPFVLFTVAAALLPSVASRSFLGESDLRVRSHAAGLTRFYLDAALGLASIRVHGAEDNLRRAHGKLLREWQAAAMRLQRAVVSLEGLQITAMFASIATMFLLHPLSGSNIGRLLLVAYWSLNLPTIGQTIGTLARQYPYYRTLTLRLFDPLGAPEELVESDGGEDITPYAEAPAIHFKNVTAEASGHRILTDIELSIESGSHVAIVGLSGAGKSSLVGMLLGWLKPKTGRILTNHELLDVRRLRRSAAWLDPAVQLWNDSLYGNLKFGSGADANQVGAVIDAAHLRTVLQELPEGLQTALGQSGARLSGGEGQRVRLGRALLRRDASVVLLDEPFRGLDRELRGQLLSEIRQHWRNSTLLCVTHDLEETRDFDRVLVMDQGRIIEDGAPSDLWQRADSRYRQLVESEDSVRTGLWGARYWRRIKLHSGRIVEELAPRPSAAPLQETEVA